MKCLQKVQQKCWTFFVLKPRVFHNSNIDCLLGIYNFYDFYDFSTNFFIRMVGNFSFELLYK